MTDEEMLACFANATVCVFAADYAEVRFLAWWRWGPRNGMQPQAYA